MESVTLPPDEVMLVVGLGGLGEDVKTGVKVAEDEDRGKKVAPGILILAEKDIVEVRSVEGELEAVKREFVEVTVGYDERVTEPTAVLVTLGDEDTDGE